MGKDTYTTTLFSDPSFLQGAARAIDLGGVYDRYNTSATGDEADRLAILSDWYATGSDLLRSIRSYREGKDESDRTSK